ncbi:hypothetical protein SEPCBS119000_000518 [Sporothrix epigloea]|uniref:RING-type domain-containing protein n=1 Tax=Sporothrix epigloea TaxID=1892477 RepID=A0ABP0D5J6_9PEZI
MSHSKRNTSRAVFTSYERSLAKAAWSASSARLTRDSFLPFASCALCLELATDPVACPAGDIFCRECALSNILAQKKELRRLERARLQAERDRAERTARHDAEDQARAIQDFELVQAGLEAKRAGNTNGSNGVLGTGSRPRETSTSSTATPTPVPPNRLLEAPPDGDDPDSTRKRKFTLDDDELQRIASEDRQRARRAIETERAAAHDALALPSFWTPSETPSTAKKEGGDTKGNGNGDGSGRKPPVVIVDVAGGTTLCPAGHDRHPYALHTLVSVQFERDAKDQRVCPACNKMLSNASKAVLAKPCGHVLCRSCVHKFVKPADAGGQAVLFDPHAPPETSRTMRCYVCEADLVGDAEDGQEGKGKKDKKDKKIRKKERIRPGLVDLRSEGTGFSAGGASEVKKNGLAFQC